MPSKKVNVRDFGARGDGASLDTPAINRAIEDCASVGGGAVVFPPGIYLSGTVRLKSGVNLVLEPGARLAGTGDLNLYETLPGRSRWHSALILGSGLEDVAIVGGGVIDGRKVFDPEGEEKMRGPHAVCLGDSRGVTIRDVTIHDAANYAVLLESCDRVDVRNARFEGGWDGVHFRSREGEFCRDITIFDCQFFTGDDCIAGWGAERLLIKDCIINTSCNGIRIIGPVRDMLVQGCLFYGPGHYPHRTQDRYNMLSGITLQPGAWCPCEGPVENVLISDCTMRDVACPVNVWLKRPGNTADRISVHRLSVSGAYRAAASVESWSDRPIGSVEFRDTYIGYRYAEQVDKPSAASPPHVDARALPAWGFYARNVKTLVLDEVRLDTGTEEGRPAVICEGVEHLYLGRLVLPHEEPKGSLVLRGAGRVEMLGEALQLR